MVRNNTGPKITHEKISVSYMIDIYCRKKHHQPKNQLCAECLDLKKYALSRLTLCRYGEQKTTCATCTTHCYQKDYKQKIRQVMQFSGPRMLLYHPVIAIHHLFRNIKSRIKH